MVSYCMMRSLFVKGCDLSTLDLLHCFTYDHLDNAQARVESHSTWTTCETNLIYVQPIFTCKRNTIDNFLESLLCLVWSFEDKKQTATRMVGALLGSKRVTHRVRSNIVKEKHHQVGNREHPSAVVKKRK